MSDINREEFREALGVLGFDDVEFNQSPWFRGEFPQMMVSDISNPSGIKLQVKWNINDKFETQNIRYITPYREILDQVKYNLEFNLKPINK